MKPILTFLEVDIFKDRMGSYICTYDPKYLPRVSTKLRKNTM